ncbi:hypothetical protein [Roseococcus pinisoli]|uniref:Uncharacterized protein n=1 Tax=Roseococcus pinisoli TaxID=2835040 RepID=A0ABS5QC62_9PROT|nr:hypothetical protein [Roseococcus pinisoli]MBS7810851.1 hypothetical protein [Roseococcus pinisoli]
MRRLVLLAALLLGAAPAMAQPHMLAAYQRPPAEVDCIASGILAIVSVDRELTGPHDGGRLGIAVTLENRARHSVSFVLNFASPNVQMAAVNQWRRLEPRARGTHFVGSMPRGTLVTDEELRRDVQLRCVR